MATTLLRLQNDNSTGDLDSIEEASDHSNDDEGLFIYDGRRASGSEDIDAFLTGLGLSQYVAEFRRQKIDQDALMLLDEDSLIEMDVAIGPRKKILKAIEERKRDLLNDDVIADTAL